MLLPCELVPPILEPVRPGSEHLPAAGARHLVRPVAVEYVSAAGGVRADAAADLDHGGRLVTECDLELLAGGSAHAALPPAMPSARAGGRRPEVSWPSRSARGSPRRCSGRSSCRRR